MAQAIELTAEQLSALDQVISQKQRGEEFFNDILGVTQQLIPVVVTVTQFVGASLAGEHLANSSLKDVVKNVPVEKLIELRKKAVQKG